MAATVGLPSLDLYLLNRLFLAVPQLAGLNTFQAIAVKEYMTYINYYNTPSTN